MSNTSAWINARGVLRGASGATALSSPLKYAIRRNMRGFKTVKGNKALPQSVYPTYWEPVISVTTDSYDDVLAHDAAVGTVEKLVLQLNKSGVNRKIGPLDVMVGTVDDHEAKAREGEEPSTQWVLNFHVIAGVTFPDPANVAAMFTDVADP